MTTPDRATVKEQQRLNWGAISAGWEAFGHPFEEGARLVTARLLELAGVRPGQLVLDVACGHGEPGLSAAEIVGPRGRVVGIDIAPEMVAVARRRADGLGNVAFRIADLESMGLPPGSFDVVLSRWGLMFACDHVAMFRGLNRALRPGGVLAAAVWSDAAGAPMISLGYQVISRRLRLPPPPAAVPGPFSMSDRDQLIVDLLEAGFVDVSVSEMVVPFQVRSTAEYVEFARAVTPPPLRRLLAALPGSEAETAVWAAVGEAAAAYRVDGAIRFPSSTLCLRAVSPSVTRTLRRTHG
jgi:SAM-dependent methyltransferase